MSEEEGHAHGHVEYRFCPRCGGGLEKRKLKVIEPERLVCLRCSFIFYLDPKVIAATIFTIEGRVALLRRGVEPAIGTWVFPGGYVDRGESVRDAAIRETQEEANVEVRLCGLLDVYSYPNSPNVIVVYAAEVIGGELRACDESVEARTFSAAEIPWEELGFESTKDALRDYLKLYLNAKT
ncbi:MAG: NUDIX hydrolase [Deltaproteobacteria bacterium]|nr:NUDIX hydrolase [Deltaproteobacteria bacterium]